MSTAPPIVPSLGDQTVYLVLDNFGGTLADLGVRPTRTRPPKKPFWLTLWMASTMTPYE